MPTTKTIKIQPLEIMEFIEEYSNDFNRISHENGIRITIGFYISEYRNYLNHNEDSHHYVVEGDDINDWNAKAIDRYLKEQHENH
jgi:hypothetical protein